MKKQKVCEHEQFTGAIEVGRILDKDPMEFVVDLKVNCAECGLPFEFDGTHFAVTADRLQLRYKLVPGMLRRKAGAN